MARFRKKPVEVEAFQYRIGGPTPVPVWFDDALRNRDAYFMREGAYSPIIIKTLNGSVVVEPGEWIIKGVEGEIYPCKDSIFRETYEEV